MIAILFVIFPLACFAADSQQHYAAYTLKAFGSLLIVLSLMFAAMYVLKKVNVASRFKSSRIKVLDRLYVDNKHSILIVEIDDKEYALGVGDDVNVISILGSKNAKDN